MTPRPGSRAPSRPETELDPNNPLHRLAEEIGRVLGAALAKEMARPMASDTNSPGDSDSPDHTAE